MLNSYLIIVLIECLLLIGIESRQEIFVSSYGVYPDDGIDDTNGIQLAINESIRSGLRTDIIFGYGIYDLSSTITIENANNLTISGQGIDKTWLIGHDAIGIFVILYSEQIELKMFSIDFDVLPFTGGYVVNVEEKYLDVEIVSPHKVDVDRQVFAILRYDPIEMRPAFGSRTYEIYQHPSVNDSKTTNVSESVLRVPLLKPTEFETGDAIVVRYVATHNCLDAQFVVDLRVESVRMYTCWCMGFLNLGVRRVTIKDYHLIPREGRWMSSIVDCIHFSDARDWISISDSQCQSMGDDGVNVHAVYFLILEIVNSTTMIIETVTGSGPLDLGVGTHLEFSRHDQPFTAYANGTIAFIHFHSANTRIVTMTNSIDMNLRDFVCVSDTPSLTITNLTVSHNRARGILLETRNIHVQQSIFNRTSGPAVLIQPSLFWYEGPNARNITLSQNVYLHNNEGIAQEKGVISILPFPIQNQTIINDILIQSSTFILGNSTRQFLQSNNANNLLIRDNYLTLTNTSTIISICNSRNLSATNNSVETNQVQIRSFFEFDQNQPCSFNLTSLIDLPNSAFNSSFPPPV